MAEQTMHFAALRLHHLNQLAECKWIDWDDQKPRENFVPDLYMRPDATLEQKASIMALTASSTSSSQLTQELDPYDPIGEFILRLFGRSSTSWVFIPTWRYPRPYLPVTPLVVVVRGETDSDEDVKSAEAETLGALHWTLTTCVVHHYRQQGWDLDRQLSDADAAVQLDDALCAYSVYYNEWRFIICAHHPKLERDAQGRHVWRFRRCPMFDYAVSMPLDANPAQEFRIISTMLAVEQQMYALGQLLRPEGSGADTNISPCS
ncbi:uncharacterized protein B0H18DRAFT_1118752 [Fomitopsis serialis]|uniref:uncharacterized protein n=1 Tax=Fomitopsis serialis TaxID=139415 RepID=UPI002008BB27|nr:uncharacterized protein B0H18DRAFT_1118752 [Neoantrodia serialis]KAH9926669.1 hypothetical protein B0H18DRAFT_1118752 [Neoantrodia serialis]